MKGTLIKNKNNEWHIFYKECCSEKGNQNCKGVHGICLMNDLILPLRLKDIKKYNEYLFNGGEVEFEIDDEIIDLGRHGSTIIRYAKITKTGAFDKEGNAITRGYVAPTESWSNVEKEYHNYSWEEGENKKFPMEYSDWLKEFYLAPIKK